MDIQEFEEMLRNVKPGHAASVPYDIFEILFPSGEHDRNARAAASSMARKHGLKIDKSQGKKIVRFYRDA